MWPHSLPVPYLFTRTPVGHSKTVETKMETESQNDYIARTLNARIPEGKFMARLGHI